MAKKWHALAWKWPLNRILLQITGSTSNSPDLTWKPTKYDILRNYHVQNSVRGHHQNAHTNLQNRPEYLFISSSSLFQSRHKPTPRINQSKHFHTRYRNRETTIFVIKIAFFVHLCELWPNNSVVKKLVFLPFTPIFQRRKQQPKPAVKHHYVSNKAHPTGPFKVLFSVSFYSVNRCLKVSIIFVGIVRFLCYFYLKI